MTSFCVFLRENYYRHVRRVVLCYLERLWGPAFCLPKGRRIVEAAYSRFGSRNIRADTWRRLHEIYERPRNAAVQS